MNRWFYKTCANLHKIFGLNMCGIYKFTFFKFCGTHAARFQLLRKIVNDRCIRNNWKGLRQAGFVYIYK